MTLGGCLRGHSKHIWDTSWGSGRSPRDPGPLSLIIVKEIILKASKLQKKSQHYGQSQWRCYPQPCCFLPLLLCPPFPHVPAGPCYLLHPQALQTQYRACGLVLATAVPCSGAMGLKGWGAPTVGPVTPQGRGTGAGDWTWLSSTEEQRHKPLCFGSPGKRWQCLAPAISSGVLWFKQSCCSLGKPWPSMIWGCYKCCREVCVEPQCGCPLAAHTARSVGQGESKGFILPADP